MNTKEFDIMVRALFRARAGLSDYMRGIDPAKPLRHRLASVSSALDDINMVVTQELQNVYGGMVHPKNPPKILSNSPMEAAAPMARDVPRDQYGRAASRQSGAYPPAVRLAFRHPKGLGYLAYIEARIVPFPAGTEDASFWHEGWEAAHDEYMESLE